MKQLFFLLIAGLVFIGCGKQSTAEMQKETEWEEKADSLRKEAKKAREVADFKKSILLADSAVDLATQTHDTVLIVKTFNELGTNFRRIGRIEQAIHFHFEALTFAEQCSDTSFQAKKNIVISCNGLGNAFMTLEETKDAERAFRKALAGEKELQSHLGQAINYANIGSLLELNGELDSAWIYYQEAMRQNEMAESKLGIGLCHIYFGQIYEKRGMKEDALREFEIASDIFLNNKDTWHAVEPAIAMANLYLENNQLDVAEPLIEKIFELAKNMQSQGHLAAAYQLLSEMHEKQGKTALAFQEYKTAIAYNDSVTNPENAHELREIYILYSQRKHNRMIEKEKQAAAHARQLSNQIIGLSCVVIVLIVVVFLLFIHSFRNQIKNLGKRLHSVSHQDDDKKSPLTVKDQAFINQVNSYIEENMEKGNITVEDICSYMGISSDTLARRMRLLSGNTPKNYIQSKRVERALKLLRETDLSIHDIAYQCGYEDMSYFTRTVKKYTGRVPSALRGEPVTR